MKQGQSDNGKFRIVARDSSATFAKNGIKFENPESAKQYGIDLACRWTALRSFAVVSVDLDPDSGGYYSRELLEKEALEIIDY